MWWMRPTLTLDQAQFGALRPGWKARARRWLTRAILRLAWRIIRAAATIAWRHRRTVAPLYTTTAAWSAAAVLHHVPLGWATALATGAAGAIPLAWWLGLPVAPRRWLPRRRPAAQLAWHLGAYTTLVALTTIQAAHGPGTPMPGMWLISWATVQAAWSWHRRIRRADAPGEREQRWEHIRGVDGTILTNVEDHVDPDRWTATVDLTMTDLLVQDVQRAAPHIGKTYGRPGRAVIVEMPADGVEHTAQLTVIRSNPCDEPITYDDRFATINDGCVPFHFYPDGHLGAVQLFQPMSGPKQFLFSGDNRTGKSGGMELLLNQAVRTGLVYPLVGDGQGGNSIPTWCGTAGLAPSQGRGPEGILRQAQALDAAFWYRNELLQARQWTDRFGDEQTGAAFYDPHLFSDLPILLWVVDELPIAVQDPDVGDDIRLILCRLAKAGPKCGIGLAFATQYPGLEEIGNSSVLRSQVLSGHALCYRNSSQDAKTMILRGDMPSPYDIPQRTGSGEHTQGMLVAASAAPGSSRPTFSRSIWVERQRHTAVESMRHCRQLDEGTGNAMATVLDLPSQLAPDPGTPDPARERIVVAPQRAVGALDRILTLLAECDEHGNPAHPNGLRTGVIAARLDMPRSTVSQTLKRAAAVGKAHRPGNNDGVWAAGPAPKHLAIVA